jgi:hypothetical protein
MLFFVPMATAVVSVVILALLNVSIAISLPVSLGSLVGGMTLVWTWLYRLHADRYRKMQEMVDDYNDRESGGGWSVELKKYGKCESCLTKWSGTDVICLTMEMELDDNNQNKL